jgi:glycogen debranching enzyme
LLLLERGGMRSSSIRDLFEAEKAREQLLKLSRYAMVIAYRCMISSPIQPLLHNLGQLNVETLKQYIPLETDLAHESEVLHNLWQKALAALQSLQTPLGVTASGQNDQFHAIFGRDSLWTVLLALEAGRLQEAAQENMEIQDGEHLDLPSISTSASYRSWLHELAASVLRGLASLQGTVVNDINEEQPGRIVHEYWNPVPQRMIAAGWPVIHGRYYGAFDATFLYLITLAEVDGCFHDEALLEEPRHGRKQSSKATDEHRCTRMKTQDF